MVNKIRFKRRKLVASVLTFNNLLENEKKTFLYLSSVCQTVNFFINIRKIKFNRLLKNMINIIYLFIDMIYITSVHDQQVQIQYLSNLQPPRNQSIDTECGKQEFVGCYSSYTAKIFG